MTDDRLHRLARELRAHLSGPPSRSPRQARVRVLARLGPRRPWTAPLRPALAAAALAALLALLLWLSPPRPERSPVGPAMAANPPALLVYELRSGTKLYLPLPAPAARANTDRAR